MTGCPVPHTIGLENLLFLTLLLDCLCWQSVGLSCSAHVRERMAGMSSERVYREPPVFTHSELVEELNSGDPCRVADALVSAVRHDDDWLWVQDECLKLLKSPHATGRWVAATCLGDRAFFFNCPNRLHPGYDGVI